MITCKICSSTFSSEKSLHGHLKAHGITVAEYYTKYYPRYNLLTGSPLPFKNKDDYFSKDFSNRSQLLKWCASEDEDVVREYVINMLRGRIESKKLSRGPGHVELRNSSMPTIDIFQKLFGSYTAACKLAGVEPMFGTKLPESFFEETSDDIKIFIDTREQKPLEFKNSESMKLEIGDYGTSGSSYTYTFVDRKSDQDFKSTLSKNNLERFRYELERAREFDCYLYIVTESSLEKIEKNNNWSPHRSNMKYIYHNMRVLAHDFADTCQFIFTGTRGSSEELIPKLLTLGDQLWNVDIQYYIDNDII